MDRGAVGGRLFRRGGGPVMTSVGGHDYSVDVKQRRKPPNVVSQYTCPSSLPPAPAEASVSDESDSDSDSDNGYKRPVQASPPAKPSISRSFRSGKYDIEEGSCFTLEEIRKNYEMKQELVRIDNEMEFVKLCDSSRLITLMSCVCCGLAPVPPSTQCAAGHLLCLVCASSSRSCSYKLNRLRVPRLCGAQILQAGGLHLYNEMFNDCLMDCPYEKLGCEGMFFGNQRRSHLAFCQFRRSICCPVFECNQRVQPIIFKRHLVAHGAKRIQGKEAVVRVMHARMNKYARLPGRDTNFRWIPAIFNFDNLDWVIVVQETRKELYLWATLMSQVDFEFFDLDSYRVCIELKEPGPGCRAGGRVWMGQIWSMTKCIDNIPGSEHCMVVLKERFEAKNVFMLGEKFQFDLRVKIGVLPEFRKK